MFLCGQLTLKLRACTRHVKPGFTACHYHISNFNELSHLEEIPKQEISKKQETKKDSFSLGKLPRLKKVIGRQILILFLCNNAHYFSRETILRSMKMNVYNGIMPTRSKNLIIERLREMVADGQLEEYKGRSYALSESFYPIFHILFYSDEWKKIVEKFSELKNVRQNVKQKKPDNEPQNSNEDSEELEETSDLAYHSLERVTNQKVASSLVEEMEVQNNSPKIKQYVNIHPFALCPECTYHWDDHTYSNNNDIAYVCPGPSIDYSRIVSDLTDYVYRVERTKGREHRLPIIFDMFTTISSRKDEFQALCRMNIKYMGIFENKITDLRNQITNAYITNAYILQKYEKAVAAPQTYVSEVREYFRKKNVSLSCD